MSTEEERLARKELEIVRLKAKTEKITQEIYHTIEVQIETDEQRELLKKYKSLDRKIDSLDERYKRTSEELHDERQKVFEELKNSLK